MNALNNVMHDLLVIYPPGLGRMKMLILNV